ncbi:MAG: peptide ABC transporter substrate-binding protein [Chloroflexia bacterium]|nr:peptide ABC transporter substrate-binding protein [Chloroflexia bacterium]
MRDHHLSHLAAPLPLGRRALIRALGLGAAGALPLAATKWRSSPVGASLQAAPSAGPTAPTGQPLAGGRLTIGSTVNPDNLHPWDATEVAAFDLLDGVVEGLLKVNAAGRLQPALAEGFTLSDDGLTYTFRLRQDVRFHNGEPFTGRDVAAAWDVRLDGIWSSAATLGWDRIAGIDLPDERTLTVTTREPYAPFLSTVGVTPILPASAFAGGVDAFRERYAEAPVGSGPFLIASRRPGRRIDLQRWDEHWGGPARLDAIRYEIVPDAAAARAGLESGSFQVAAASGNAASLADDPSRSVPTVTTWEYATRTWHHLDLKQIGFLRERAVRQALDYATPRQAIVAELLGGRATPAVADQMPGSWAAHDTLGPRSFDPARARELLAEAGFRPGRDGILARVGEPFRLELWGVAGDPLARRILDAIATEWAALGLAVLVRTAEPTALWGPTGYQFSDRMTACLFAWTNGVDPDDLFYWHSSQIPSAPTAPGSNLPAFFHPYAFQDEIDRLTADAATTLDLETRRDLYRQIQELLAREVPVIFLYWEHALVAARTEVGGVWPNPYAGLLWNAQSWYLADPAAEATPAATPWPVDG